MEKWFSLNLQIMVVKAGGLNTQIKIVKFINHMGKKLILVTGSSGYIGSQMMKLLKDLTWECIGIDKQEKKNVSHLSFNLCDEQRVKETLNKLNPSHIIHAGTNSAGEYQKNFLNSFKEDFMSLNNILDSIIQSPKIRLVFFSSSYVYSGLPGESIVTEEIKLSPEHNFGIAKLFFENLIMRTHENSVIYRLSNVFGSGEQQNVTALNSWINGSIKGEDIEVWGTGKRKVQYIHIQDVSSSILNAINMMKPGIYNLGGDDYLSMLEVAKKIAKFFGIQVKLLKDKQDGEQLAFMKTKKYNTNFKMSLDLALHDYLKIKQLENS